MRAPSLRAVTALLALGALAGCGETAGSGAPQPTSGAGPSTSGGEAGMSGASAEGGALVGTAGFVSAGGGGGAGGVAGTAGSSAVFAPPDFPNYALTGSWPNRPVALTAQPGKLSFTKVTLHTRFLAESCAIGDYDGDGNPDVSSGRRWYRGPFTGEGSVTPIEEHVFRGGHDDLPRSGLGTELVTGISDDYSDFAFDMDGDGDVDIVNIASPEVDEKQTPSPAPAPQPHATAYWYENPGPELAAQTDAWQAHLIHDDVRHEQHGIGDVDGDGWPEIYGACSRCSPPTTFGYYQRNPSYPTGRWNYRAVTLQKEFPYGGTGLLHGLGFGDVDNDGKPDLIDRDGAWLDVLSLAPNSKGCPSEYCGLVQAQFYGGGEYPGIGGSHMFATDVDGDGDNDVISADLAHNYGVSWWENLGSNTLQFQKYKFVGNPNDASVLPVFSQPHALELVDLDADGIPEVVTGKTRLANPDGCGDPDLMGDPVSFAFKILRNQPSVSGSVTFQPFPIDTSSGAPGTETGKAGIGRQIAVGHLDRDGIVDVCLATKLGLFVYLGQ